MILQAYVTNIVPFNVVCTVHKILVIRLYFPLGALHVSDFISPSSGATL